MSTTTVIRPEMQIVPRQPLVLPGVPMAEPCAIVIFGATGDLAARKLLPALFGLWHSRFLPARFAIVGVARRPKSDDAFRAEVETAIHTFRKDSLAIKDGWETFLSHVHYHRADLTSAESMQGLAQRLKDLDAELRLSGNRLFYLATDPEFFGPAIERLAGAGLVGRDVERPWARVVIEKPFGHDLASAVELDRHVVRFLKHDQAFRIDHYLGKETVQNLMAFRFGNAIFEPLLTRQYVDHVQITVAESIGIEGKRGDFYDHAGALRDVVQNHMLQLLALVAMDPPATLKASDVGIAKLNVLRSLVPLRGPEVTRRVVRGQFGPGAIDGKPVGGYRDEEGVARDSSTETYVALRTSIENWRWAGVPFLLRTGKRLPKRVTEIAIQFKLPPLRLFQTVECEGDVCDLREALPTVLVFRIQPDEGISLSFSAKRPGMQFVLHPVRFEFDYGKSFQLELPEAYERLLLDALRGDTTLFMRSDELQAAWEFATPILDAWQSGPVPPFPNYAAGTWGPSEADRLLEGCSSSWREP
ncbi:MAG TPA: glucose-6-phosphate dehydrogenase [Planctomycetaceae bacterium]|nr:glucose-6-phosphate dehydrogenase [Planctomycetaceae bacterium]